MRSSASLSHSPRRLLPRSTIAIARFPNFSIPRPRKTSPPCRHYGRADRSSTPSCRAVHFLKDHHPGGNADFVRVRVIHSALSFDSCGARSEGPPLFALAVNLCWQRGRHLACNQALAAMTQGSEHTGSEHTGTVVCI